MIVERYTITSCRKVVPKSAKRISSNTCLNISYSFICQSEFHDGCHATGQEQFEDTKGIVRSRNPMNEIRKRTVNR